VRRRESSVWSKGSNHALFNTDSQSATTLKGIAKVVYVVCIVEGCNHTRSPTGLRIAGIPDFRCQSGMCCDVYLRLTCHSQSQESSICGRKRIRTGAAQRISIWSSLIAVGVTCTVYEVCDGNGLVRNHKHLGVQLRNRGRSDCVVDVTIHWVKGLVLAGVGQPHDEFVRSIKLIGHCWIVCVANRGCDLDMIVALVLKTLQSCRVEVNVVGSGIACRDCLQICNVSRGHISRSPILPGRINQGCCVCYQFYTRN